MQEPQEMQVQSVGGEDPLEKEIATHSSILAWKIPWTEEPARLQSTGSQKELDPTGQLHFRPAVPGQECKERNLLDSV